MKKSTLIIVFVAIIALIFGATCPNKQAHATAIKEAVTAGVGSELKASNGNNSLLEKGLNFLGSTVASSFADAYLEANLTVDNYLVCSVGSVMIDGEKKNVSYGLLNKVFTFSEDDVRQAIKKK